MSRETKRPRGETASAAEWFVALDSSAPDEVGAARFAAWLDRAAENEVELERCETAVAIARGLADDPELRWAFDEAAAIAKRDPAATRRALARRALRRFGWAAAVAAATLAAVAALWLARETPGPTRSVAQVPTVRDVVASRPSPELSASIAAAAAAYPIARLPSGVVVDASSVAVLPFTAPQDGGRPTRMLAASLSQDIGSTLAALPGVYVVGTPRAAAYIGTELDASELGEQLGVRGVVVGELAEHDGQVRVAIELLDAATDERLWRAEYERPADELASLADEIGGEITNALIDPAGRARAVAATPSFRDARADNRATSTRAEFALQ